MSLDIYFKENIARILCSINDAAGGTTALVSEELEKLLDSEEMADHLRIYQRGYRDALAAVAQAFGIGPEAHRIDQKGGRMPVIIEDCIEYVPQE